MAQVKIQAPDGLIRTIEYPDGADPTPAYEWVQKDYAERQKKAKAESDPTAGMSWLEKGAAGFGSGLVNKGLGIQQFLNAISGGRIGDKAALDKEVAEKKALDRPLTSGGLTSVGGFGEALGEMLPDVALGGPFALGRTAAARFLPGVAARGAFRIPGALAAGAAEGAVQNATTAAENYDLERELKQGAMFGAGGEVAGRALGRVAAPFRKSGASESAAQEFKVLEDAGIPRPTAVNMTDAANIKRFHNAVAQLPIFNRPINAAHDANLGWFTKRKTGLAGTPVEELTPTARDAIQDGLSNTAEAFKAGPDVPLGNIPADMLALHGRMADTMMATGGNQNRLVQLLNNAMAQPTYTAKSVMEARRKLSREARGHSVAQRFAEADTAKGLQQIYEDALKATHPDGGAAFEQWKKQYGAWKDVKAASDVGGGVTTPKLEPTDFSAKTLDTNRRAAPELGSEDAFTVAAANRMPPLPGTENRAWITALLMGAPLLTGGGNWLFGDKDLTPSAAAAGVVPATGLTLAAHLLGTKGGGKYLLGKYRGQGEVSRERLRQLLTAGAQQAHD